jgi:hypothetical protein
LRNRVGFKQFGSETDGSGMLSAVFSTTFRTLGARWAPILGAVVVSAVLTILVTLVVLMPSLGSLRTPTPLQPQAAAATTYDPATGMPVAAPVTPSTTTLSAAGGVSSGAVMMALVGFGLILALSIATATTGVFAAAGMGAMEALREGARTSPHAIVQTVRLTWPGMAAYLAGFLAIVALHGAGVVLGLPLILGGMFLLLRSMGTVWLAIGAIAHGHVEWAPDAARAVADGRRWTATGVGVVGTLFAGLCNFIPLAGPIFVSAFTSAMWEEFDGGGVGPADPGEAPAPIDPSAPAPATPATVTQVASADVPAPQLVAGPTWTGVASVAAPAGQWIELACATRVGVQLQWTTGAAPRIQLADQAGAWRTPPGQPAESGGTTWLELPQGWTWIALVPSDPTTASQQVWIASWLPADAVPAAAQAA